MRSTARSLRIDLRTSCSCSCIPLFPLARACERGLPARLPEAMRISLVQSIVVLLASLFHDERRLRAAFATAYRGQKLRVNSPNKEPNAEAENRSVIGRPVAFGIAVLAITLAAPAAGHDVSKPAWFYCYRACITALEKGDSPIPDPCAGAQDEALCNWTKPSPPPDGGAAFERFKTCNSLCKGIQQ